MEFEKAIQRAYSSKLRIERRGDRAVILKSVQSQERKNEMAFHALLKELQLPSMTIIEEGEDLAINFIEGAETLGDCETPERYEQLGRVLRLFHSQEYPSPFWVDADGIQHDIDWETFLRQQIARGVTRQRERNGLEPGTVDRIVATLSIAPRPKRITPVHGDLHVNNVLLKEERLYLFDKADCIFAGDPLYDLSLFGITLPGVYGVGVEVERDKSLMRALAQGYGEDFLADYETFDRYVLLRAMERWPNPFEQEIPELVKAILDRNK
ncbi:MAG: phosphotransferase [Patescibacteria group bacterium]